jgi:hypothetical protein
MPMSSKVKKHHRKNRYDMILGRKGTLFVAKKEKPKLKPPELPPVINNAMITIGPGSQLDQRITFNSCTIVCLEGSALGSPGIGGSFNNCLITTQQDLNRGMGGTRLWRSPDFNAEASTDQRMLPGRVIL